MTGPARLLADWPCYHAAVRAGLDPAGVPVRPFDGVPWWEWHADRGDVQAALRHLPVMTPGAAAAQPDPRGGRGS